MAKPWEELHTQISTDKELQEAVAYKGLTCKLQIKKVAIQSRDTKSDPKTAGLEIHAGWCGPCTAVVPTLKKLQWDLVEERSAAVQFVVCNSDNVEAFKVLNSKSAIVTDNARHSNAVKQMTKVNQFFLKQCLFINSILIDATCDRSEAVSLENLLCRALPFRNQQEYRDRSKPLFMIYRKGNKLTVVEGVNTSALKVPPYQTWIVSLFSGRKGQLNRDLCGRRTSRTTLRARLMWHPRTSLP